MKITHLSPFGVEVSELADLSKATDAEMREIIEAMQSDAGCGVLVVRGQDLAPAALQEALFRFAPTFGSPIKYDRWPGQSKAVDDCPYLALLGNATLTLAEQSSSEDGTLLLEAHVRSTEPTAMPSSTGAAEQHLSSGTRTLRPPSRLQTAAAATMATPMLKQVVVSREPPLVMVYDVVSWGRVWYRQCVFTSDARISLHEPRAGEHQPHLNMPPPPEYRGADSVRMFVLGQVLVVGR